MLAGAFPLAIAGLNRLGLGPLRADLSGVELRRASLRAMGEVVARLRIDARHVIFGHTHRSGPLPDDDPNEWRLAGGAPARSTPAAGSTSRCTSTATGAIRTGPARRPQLDDGGEPRFVRLLEGVDAGALRPPAAPAPGVKQVA